MGVTYTTAAERDVRQQHVQTARWQLADLSIAMTSVVAMLAIALAYLGRINAF